MIREYLLKRATAVMASRPPDFEIGPEGDRYLRRWIVGPWGRGDPRKKLGWKKFGRKFPNLYLHEIRHDDEDSALHDHPFASASMILENGYWEILFYPCPPNESRRSAPKGSRARPSRSSGRREA